MVSLMIPKVIHYCWFGRCPLPDSAKKCISSWREYLPDYKIIEWNEDNFDVDSIPYTREAYAAKKYAFVSDYARCKILYTHGGLYFDTDVEVIKPLDDVIANGPFMGFEINPSENHPFGAVNPGLGLGAVKSMDIYRKILDYYKQLHYYNSDGSENKTTIVTYVTEILSSYMNPRVVGIQKLNELTIYPKDYFNPFEDNTGQLDTTPNTRTIHWYNKSWLCIKPWRIKLSRFLHRILGTSFTVSVRKMLSLK